MSLLFPIFIQIAKWDLMPKHLEHKLGNRPIVNQKDQPQDKNDSQTYNLLSSGELNDAPTKIQKNQCSVARYILCPVRIAPNVQRKFPTAATVATLFK